MKPLILREIEERLFNLQLDVTVNSCLRTGEGKDGWLAVLYEIHDIREIIKSEMNTTPDTAKKPYAKA